MKKVTKVLVLLVLALGIGYGANAQGQKIAYVETSAVAENMPEAAKMQQDLQAYANDLQAELQAMVTEYQNKVKEFRANESAGMPNIVRQTKENEINDLGQRIQDFQANGENALEEKRMELMKPLLEKIQNAINAVGKEKGLTYVLDKSLGIVVYIGADAIDITADVKKKLGM